MTNPRNYLFTLEDGLEMRESQEYARDKLYAVQAYLQMARRAMRAKPWSAFNYIDLQAGPGKNRIGDKILLGSPLLALNIDPPFTHYWFNEWSASTFTALEQRISASPNASKVHLFQKDVNEAVDIIVESITEMDKQARNDKKWSTFNVAFLDPEGLEITWHTVERLAQVARMDLIINFSTSGINRNLHQAEVIDRFYGSQQWRTSVSNSNPKSSRRRQFIDIYRDQLESFGYYIATDDTIGYHDIVMRNSKNAEVYSLIFASKHALGDDFWSKVKQQIEKIRHGSDRLL